MTWSIPTIALRSSEAIPFPLIPAQSFLRLTAIPRTPMGDLRDPFSPKTLTS